MTRREKRNIMSALIDMKEIIEEIKDSIMIQGFDNGEPELIEIISNKHDELENVIAEKQTIN